MLGVQEMELDAVYLGNQLVMGRNLSKVYGKLKERVQNGLEGWQSQLFSKHVRKP